MVMNIATFMELLLVVLFIYTLLGLELFANKVKINTSTNEIDFVNGSSPQFNFDTLMNSFTTVFIILTNDTQSGEYYNYYRTVGSFTASIYWITFVTLAQKVLLSLFLSILLQNFNEGSLKSKMIEEEEEHISLISEQGEKKKWFETVKIKILAAWTKA